MGEGILRLYRDAAQPAMARLGRNLERAAARPGLSIMAAEDHLVGTNEQRRRASARAGAHHRYCDRRKFEPPLTPFRTMRLPSNCCAMVV